MAGDGDQRFGAKLAAIIPEVDAGPGGSGVKQLEIGMQVWYRKPTPKAAAKAAPNRAGPQGTQSYPAVFVRGVVDGAITKGTGLKGDSLKVKALEGGAAVDARVADVFETNDPPPDDDFDTFKSCSALVYPNDPSVLEVLHKRLVRSELIYTFSALNSLIICNPFKVVACIQDPEALPRFKAPLTPEELDSSAFVMQEAHIWALCRNAWCFQVRNNQNISFIIQGESGAGKTETAKHVMLYFSTRPEGMQARQMKGRASSFSSASSGRMSTAQPSDDGTPNVQRIMMFANPIMEALGNARTIRNDNSSRFGRFVKLFNNEEGVVQASEISIYFLEKSRVCLQPQEERNYHVFYQILAGTPDDLKQKYKLRKGPLDYGMLKKSGCIKVASIDDGEEWHNDVEPSLRAIGVRGPAMDDVMCILSAVLMCGEVQWIEGENGAAACGNPAIMIELAELLGVDSGRLTRALSTRNRRMPRGSIVSSPLNSSQATETTESIARHCYEEMFEWLIDTVNVMSKGPNNGAAMTSGQPWTGVLDIFGFEAFKINSLEQLLINYCNERLHQLFVDNIYKREIQLHHDEGIELDIEFTDNVGILECIDAPKVGIISFLEEQCQLEMGTNPSFTKACHDRFKKTPSPCYATPKIAPDQNFEIKHSCGPVKYLTDGFREKNMDMMLEDVQALLLGTSRTTLATIVNEAQARVAAAQEGIAQQAGKAPKRLYIAGQFLRSISSLFNVLWSSEPRFVKCVKSNMEKLPLQLDESVVLTQLHTLSILESLRTEKQGYTYKKLFREFLVEYSTMFIFRGMFPEDVEAITDEQEQRKYTLSVLQSLKPSSGPPGFALGHTKVFITSTMHRHIEKARLKIRAMLQSSAIRVQSSLRARPALARYHQARQRLVGSQSMYRRYLGGEKMRRRKHRLFGLLIAAGLSLVHLFHIKKVSKAAITIQKHARRVLARDEILFRKKKHAHPWARAVIHGVHRSYCARAEILRGRELAAIDLMQKTIRGRQKQYVAQLELLRRKQAAAVEMIQNFFRARESQHRSGLELMRCKKLAAIEFIQQFLHSREAVFVARLEVFEQKKLYSIMMINRVIKTRAQMKHARKVLLERRQDRSSHLLSRQSKVHECRLFVVDLLHHKSRDILSRAIKVSSAKVVLWDLRFTWATEFVQRVALGMLGRKRAREAAYELRSAAARELRVYLEVMKLRMRFAEHKKSEGFHLAGKALSVSRSWNYLMGFTGRYHQPRFPTPPPTKTVRTPVRQPLYQSPSDALGGDAAMAASSGQLGQPSSFDGPSSPGRHDRNRLAVPGSGPGSSQVSPSVTPGGVTPSGARTPTGRLPGHPGPPGPGSPSQSMSPRTDSQRKVTPARTTADPHRHNAQQHKRAVTAYNSLPAQLQRWMTRARQEAHDMYSSGVLNPQVPESRPGPSSPSTSPVKERPAERPRGPPAMPQEASRVNHGQNRAVTPPGRGDLSQSPYRAMPSRAGAGAVDALDAGLRTDDNVARSLSPELGPRTRPHADVMTPRPAERVLGEELPSGDAGPRVPPLRLGATGSSAEAASPPNSARSPYTPRAESPSPGQDRRPRAAAKAPAAKSGHAFGASVSRFPATGASSGTSPRQTGISAVSSGGSFRAPARTAGASGALGSFRGSGAPATAKSWAGASSAPRRAVSPGRQSPGTDRGAGASGSGGGRWR